MYIHAYMYICMHVQYMYLYNLQNLWFSLIHVHVTYCIYIPSSASLNNLYIRF